MARSADAPHPLHPAVSKEHKSPHDGITNSNPKQIIPTDESGLGREPKNSNGSIQDALLQQKHRWILSSYSHLEAAKRSQGARTKASDLVALTPFLPTVGGAESVYLHITGLRHLSTLTRTSKISSIPENGERGRRAAGKREAFLLCLQSRTAINTAAVDR